jgi:hypothetical protein
MTNLRLRTRWPAQAAAGLMAAAATAGCLPAAAVAATTAPTACRILTGTLAASLLEEQPRTIVSTPLVCQYGRASERASTTRSTVGLTIVRNASVATAKMTQLRLERLAPRKSPPGMTGFARGRIAVPNGEATYVYFRQAGGPIVGGFVFLRIGSYTAQLTPQVAAKAGRAFTAADLRTVATRLGANWRGA